VSTSDACECDTFTSSFDGSSIKTLRRIKYLGKDSQEEILIRIVNKPYRRLSSGQQTTRVKSAHGRGHGIQKPHLCQFTRSNNRRRWQRPLPGLPSDQLRHGERLAPGPDHLETPGVTDGMRQGEPPGVWPHRVCQVLVSHWGATLHQTATATKMAIKPMRLVISVSSR
jgi:hypothetical protein